MNKYQHLLDLQASGELKILMNEYGLSTQFLSWMEIYQYHLDHPKLSQFQVALKFGVSKHMVWNVYHFMNQTLI